ncbi:SigE family RNA polymerase sigma factor [Nonomuraea cavernae]|uniref:DNA-directed RNA polymerase sigma-70 factor n=1 Tax=Nonomuraea cavernae TaxID=2045107 RepID=A0A917ZB78_9ACTN|nr:SigE family RNA polymerase sigma factor [Nonomuraea cavernae]MCA2185657.1 SigE family RNA polymerase sigma factor [Nonomuraea cavernae]GGO78185.1 DNA-directed RNA polymerase sigma-70 factor [Nonomuraea cavernae]
MDRHDDFREFVLARQQVLMRTAYLLTGDAHLAEDLLQSVLIKVAGKWPKLSGGNPEAYVRKALVNQYISWKRRPRPEVLGTELPERGASHDDAALHRIVLRQALARLAPRQRAVIVLRFWEDLTEAQTAEALGCSPGTVKSQAHHALARLRAFAPELACLLNDSEMEEVAR